jgi:hypothetical protein
MPNLLTRFQQLGQNYIDRHADDNFIQKRLHTNNNFAAQIAQFQQGDMETIRDFALETYFHLPNTDGELAQAIKNFITNVLRVDWNNDLYKFLPLNTLKNIGEDYLKKYPSSVASGTRFFSWHNHQHIAQSLAAGKNHVDQSTLQADAPYYQKWRALLSAYSELENPFGQIAQKIENIIRVSHQSDFIIITKTTNDRAAMPRGTGTIANEIYRQLFYIWKKPQRAVVELADLRRGIRP